MPASASRPRSALLAAAAAAAGLWLSGAARADPPPVHAPVHHPVRRPSGHAHAGPRHAAARPAPPHRAPPPAVAVPPAAAPVPALPPAPPRGTSTGLPLPRFAALRADSVYLRRGPGSRYPIEWVYKRRDLPVKIEREFDVWRLIEDPDGIRGWVHQATLVGTRSFVIPAAPADTATADTATADAATADAAATDRGADRGADPGTDAAAVAPPAGPPGSQVLRAAPQPDAPAVAVLEPGVIGRLRTCAAGAGWCRVTVKDYAGWLPRRAVWGLLPDEAIPSP